VSPVPRPFLFESRVSIRNSIKSLAVSRIEQQ
jgi:hypothetical protein